MSRSFRAPRAPAVLAALLLLATAASGCFGGDAKDETIDPGTDPSVPGTPTPDPNETIEQIDPDKAVEKDVSVPQAHQHHHWGNPPQPDAFLFDAAVTLQQEECRPERFGKPPCYDFPDAAHIGIATFTPENDGDDVTNNDEKGIAAGNKADAVLAGTSHVTVTLTWTDENVGELLFFYRSAKNPQFLPETGIPVESGTTFTIDIERGMADIAHQVSVSKWAFRLVANGGPQDGWAAPVKVGSGDVDVEILIHNGGEASIDPPHPNPWSTTVLPLGKTSGDLVVLSASHTVYEDGAQGIQIPQPYIVPPGSAKVTVLAWVNATDPNQKPIMDTMGWALAYHGADTLEYSRAPDGVSDDGFLVFDIPLSEIQWDSPYARESLFAFKIFPKAGDAASQGDVGYLDVEYTLAFSVERDPEYVFN